MAAAVGGIIGGLGSAFGGFLQYRANEDAAHIQQQSANKALAAAAEQQTYNRTQHANYLQRLQPYSQIGQSSYRSLADILGTAGIPSVRN